MSEVSNDPAGGMGGELSPEHDRHARGTARLEARAIAGRWPMAAELRSMLIEKMGKILQKEAVVVAVDENGQPVFVDNARNQVNAAKALLAAEAQNQADEHAADKNARIDAGKPTDLVGEVRLKFDSEG